MKQLILLRHAKAVTKYGAGDFDRILAADGRREMALVAADIRSSALRPDLALVSPSARTRETWTLTGIDGIAPRYEQAIYDASVETLLELVQSVPDDVRRLMMVGHNPGCEELAIVVANAESASEIGLGMTTAALAVFDLPDGSWGDLEAGAGRLVHFATPASLAAAKR